MKFRAKCYVFLLIVIMIVITGCSNEQSDETVKDVSNEDNQVTKIESNSEDVHYDTTLQVAYPYQPTTLDVHVTTGNATKHLGRLIFESLIALDENYEIKPQLAESYELSEDGKVHTFKLRKGIKFHNGKEMKADDVVASMDKWINSASGMKDEFGQHKWVQIDDYTVELQVEKFSSFFPYYLTKPANLPGIMPKEIIEAADETGVTEYIGTGPYKFVEWKDNQYLHFTKFEDYQSVSEPASGLAGKKEALVNDIYINFISDESIRVSGLISGEYDIALDIPYDAVEQIENAQGKLIETIPTGFEILIFNRKQGLFENVKARQAVNYALDKEMVMKSAFVDEKYYRLGPGIFNPEQTSWYTDAGKELYNPKDKEKAKSLLEEIGYNGEEVVILTSRDYPTNYKAALATQSQLQEIGMNVVVEVYDQATVLERREKPELFDFTFTDYPPLEVPRHLYFGADWVGGVYDEDFDKLLTLIKAEKSQQKAKELFTELQQLMWEKLPIINIGGFSSVVGYTDKVSGYKDFDGPILWNVSKKK